MQLPSIDRNPNARPLGADLASSGVSSVLPVAPVNPSVSASPALEPAPSVIIKINPARKPNEGEPVYTSVSDPAKRGSEAATSPKDWTVYRPVAEKVEALPAKPVTHVLMDHMKALWNSGTNPVQVEQVKNQLTAPRPAAPADALGDYAKQVLVYSPTKIKRPENI